MANEHESDQARVESDAKNRRAFDRLLNTDSLRGIGGGAIAISLIDTIVHQSNGDLIRGSRNITVKGSHILEN